MDIATSVGAPIAPITQRLSRTTAYLPIVYGSVAFFLGKKADEFQTHEWTLFLRGPNHEDLSPAISKVVFQLHPSFAQPTRELTSPPYKVTERGWGEFEAQIRILWRDASERTTIINHTIKLYPPGMPPNVLSTDTETPVVAETYDEVVFTDPSESFFRGLTQIPALSRVDPAKDDMDNEEEKAGSGGKKSGRKYHSEFMNIAFSDQEDFLALVAAQQYLQEELEKVKQRFQVVTDEIATVDQKMVELQQQEQREPSVSLKSVAGSTAAKQTPHPSAAAAATASKITLSGRKTKTPSKQRKVRPVSQAKKVKSTSSPPTISTPAKASSSLVPTSVDKTLPK